MITQAVRLSDRSRRRVLFFFSCCFVYFLVHLHRLTTFTRYIRRDPSLQIRATLLFLALPSTHRHFCGNNVPTVLLLPSKGLGVTEPDFFGFCLVAHSRQSIFDMKVGACCPGICPGGMTHQSAHTTSLIGFEVVHRPSDMKRFDLSSWHPNSMPANTE